MTGTRCYGCMNIKTQSPVCEHCGYDERQAAAHFQLQPGTPLQGKYMVGQMLDKSAQVQTYLGWALQYNAPVWIREYYPVDLADRNSAVSPGVGFQNGAREAYTRGMNFFMQQARILLQLGSQPQFPRQLQAFPENNTVYTVMEFTRGESLADRMRRQMRPFTPAELLPIVDQVLEALDRMHAAGLLHMNLSRENILLLPDGGVQLVGFELPGSYRPPFLPYHCAPELYQRNGRLGPWTDVYALCATICHCLTGKPFVKASDRIAGESCEDWDSIPGLTEHQREALKKGLELRAEVRYHSAAELREALRPRPQPFAPDIRQGESGTIQLGEEQVLPFQPPVIRQETAGDAGEENNGYTAPLGGFGSGGESAFSDKLKKLLKNENFIRLALIGVILAVAMGLGMLKNKQAEPAGKLGDAIQETWEIPETGDTGAEETTMDEWDILDATENG